MPFILQTSGLSKKIGSKALVTNVNIHIPKGEIYGFLGPICFKVSNMLQYLSSNHQWLPS